MATLSPNQDLERLDARERAAWALYKNSLDGLDHEEYDDAEALSWAKLQDVLGEIESQRAQLRPS